MDSGQGVFIQMDLWAEDKQGIYNVAAGQSSLVELLTEHLNRLYRWI